jgi:hypothetical protein
LAESSTTFSLSNKSYAPIELPSFSNISYIFARNGVKRAPFS